MDRTAVGREVRIGPKIQGWTEAVFFGPKPKPKLKVKKLWPSAEGLSLNCTFLFNIDHVGCLFIQKKPRFQKQMYLFSTNVLAMAKFLFSSS